VWCFVSLLSAKAQTQRLWHFGLQTLINDLEHLHHVAQRYKLLSTRPSQVYKLTSQDWIIAHLLQIALVFLHQR
jgi:hypothetical protein